MSVTFNHEFENFQAHLSQGGIVVMDGGLGSELAPRGIELGRGSWSAHALLSEKGRKVVEDIHTDNIVSGARLIIANTFRTPALGKDAVWATIKACHLAYAAKIGQGGLESNLVIAGSAGPVRDCYTPEDTPDNATLRQEHREHAQNLADSNVVNIYLAETMITLREIEAALEAGTEAGLPVAVSFCTEEENGTKLRSGEPLERAVALAREFDATFVGINCVEFPIATQGLRELREHTDQPIAVYAQGGHDVSNLPTHTTPEQHQADYVKEAELWLQLGAQLVGGCCGVTPDYIRQIAAKVPQHQTIALY
jgi:S-methylmethionine-dependent homocysteine/selenocysteine methylase